MKAVRNLLLLVGSLGALYWLKVWFSPMLRAMGWYDGDWSPMDLDKDHLGRDLGYVLEHNDTQLMRSVHPPDLCVDDASCTIHNRSDHHMRSWPQHWRGDRGMMERICPHGVGHPDPDEISPDTVHGCDGCCSPGELPPPSPGTVVRPTLNPIHKPTVSVVDGMDGFTPDMLRWRKPSVLVDWNDQIGNVVEAVFDRGLNKGDTVRLRDFENDNLDAIGVVVDLQEAGYRTVGDVVLYTFEVRR